jgi:hypothetical protein
LFNITLISDFNFQQLVSYSKIHKKITSLGDIMFEKPVFNLNFRQRDILKNLSLVYSSYNNANWDYARVGIGYGSFIVDECIKSSEFLKKIAIFIGKGLSENNSDATIASRLFQKLYNEGFSGGDFKNQIQNNFKEILPPESINRLNDGASMADCMKSIFTDQQQMAVASMKP